VERALTQASRRGVARGALTGGIAVAVVLTANLGAQADTAPTQRERADGSPEITIPFRIGPANCVDRARLYKVTMRIYNVLAQPVGLPVLVSGHRPDTGPPSTDGPPIVNLRLPCGRYVARWNGQHAQTGRRLAPGVYVTELVIDGQRVTRKMTLDP
jgi:hypothetical protein